MVKVRLLGNLVSITGERELEWEIQDPLPLRQLLESHQQEIPGVMVNIDQNECLLTVSNRIATNTTLVRDGDMIKITSQNTQLHYADFPPWHGGTV